MRAAYPVLLLVVPLLAGCGDPAPGSDLPTAKAHLKEAEAWAKEWHSDAMLVAVMGVELAKAQNRSVEDGLFLATAVADPSVGDGRARAWSYVYSSGGNVASFIIAANGTRQFEQTWFEQFPARLNLHPVGHWSIDSAEALAAARSSSSGFDDVVRAGAEGAIEYLCSDGNATMWGVRVSSGAGNASVWIDASSGEPRTPQASCLMPNVLPLEGGSISDVLATPQSDDVVTFSLNRSYSEMPILLAATTAGGPVMMTMTLVRPDGTSSQTRLSMLAPGTPGQTLATQDTVKPVAAGTYEVTIHLDVGVNAAYTLSWCPGEQDLRNPMCSA